MDKGNAELHRVRDTPDSDALTIDPYLAYIRLIDTTEDLHEGGFASAVLAAERNSFPTSNLQVHFVQRHYSRESLGDSAHFEQRRRHRETANDFNRKAVEDRGWEN